ncbi:PilZ domain-containing protein [Inhella proteolytica]|uniref:Cyclic diguanosine monophosphate-binding protein n=1 Tax=Inhella proteolytica TaxID=2795029 RepID=A0A931IZU1_9BURK|nr:PilZ domain-containing protein [Inhella proteolytica]MBH9576083.1 PilZ domain-containing protein [Inhella proteolytica]
MSAHEERRQFARIHFDAQAQLSTVDTRLDVQLLDISLQGALVRLPAGLRVEPGEPCLLALRLGDVTIKMAAELAHVKADHAGLQCRSIDLESISHLRRLVEVNLGKRELLERELRALVA